MAEGKTGRETHRSYTVSFKLKAVEVAKKKSIASASREFGVDRKRIREWKEQESTLEEFMKDGNSRSKRLKGAGRKAHHEDMEEGLFEWITGRNLRVSRAMIMRQAKTLVSDDDSFQASTGWLSGFMTRKGLSLRKKITVCQNPPAACIDKLVNFNMHLRKLIIQHQFKYESIYAMDETACWMGMPSDTTVHFTGARSVSLKTSGHEKDHYTVVLTAKADGLKLQPFVVFKGKGTRLIKNLSSIPGVVVRFMAG